MHQEVHTTLERQLGSLCFQVPQDVQEAKAALHLSLSLYSVGMLHEIILIEICIPILITDHMLFLEHVVVSVILLPLLLLPL